MVGDSKAGRALVCATVTNTNNQQPTTNSNTCHHHQHHRPPSTPCMSMAQTTKESVREYSERFLSTLNSLEGEPIDSPTNLFLFVDGLRRDINSAYRVVSTVCQAETFDKVVSRLALSVEPKIDLDWRKKKEERSTSVCNFCKKKGHNEEACFKKRAEEKGKAGEKTTRGIMTSTRGGGAGGLRCYNCDEPGHRKIDCPKKKLEKKVNFTDSVKINAIDAINDVCDGIVSNPLLIPLAIGGLQVMGKVDTGADVSVLSCDLVRRLDEENSLTCRSGGSQPTLLELEPRELELPGGVVVKSEGKRREVEVLCDGRRVIKHEFEILSMSVEALIGLDLLPKLGIVISGAPTRFPSEIVASARTDEDDELVASHNESWRMQDQYPEQGRSEFLVTVESALLRNEDVSTSQPCLFPSAEVS